MPTDDSTPADEGDDEGDAADSGIDDPAEGVRPDVPRAPDLTDDEPGLVEELTAETSASPDVSGGEVDSELAKQFWSLVVLFNVALFAMALGLLLAGFERRLTLGGALFAVGAAAFARGWHRYRSVRKD